MLKTGIILIAAGESKRLGRPKQLLPFRGMALLRYAAGVALEAGTGPVAVVLGANSEECREVLEGLSVRVAMNALWREGMGTSIAKGMEELCMEQLDSVIVMLCDQPAVTPETLRQLTMQQRATGKPVVASIYGDVTGPPVLFTSAFFSRLRSLRGSQGAKSLFGEETQVATVPLPNGQLDVDEPADVETLRQFESR